MPLIPPVTLPTSYPQPVQAALYTVPGSVVANLPGQRQNTVVTQSQKPYLTFQDLSKVQPADVLVVLAHPDDEILLSGTLVQLARSGKDIQLVYATNGKAGEDVSGRGLKNDALGTERTKEVSAALKQLNLQRPPLILDFMDGETSRYPLALEETLRAVFLQAQPKEVYLMNAETGVTGHDDHKQVSRTVDNILDTIAQGNNTRDLRDQEKLQPLLSKSAVYQVSISQSGLQQFRNFFPESNPSWKSLQASPNDRISLRVNIPNDIAQLKQQSQAAHRSQYRPDDISTLARFYQSYPYEEFIKYQIQSSLPPASR